MSQPPGAYRGQPRAVYQQPYDPQPPYAGGPVMHQPPPVPRAPRSRWIPGAGLVLTLAGLVIQVLSLTVLPWVLIGAGEPDSVSMPRLWDLATELGTHGFGGWYVVLFSYPLAALGIVLALAAVLDSVALKVIWGGLALLGLGILVLRYGFGPFAELALADQGTLDFSRQEITTALIAVAAAVIVIVALKAAVSMFRRVAGLILLALAGVHVAAVVDLVKGSGLDNLGVGAYGPAAGYVLVAIAAFIGPRRLSGG